METSFQSIQERPKGSGAPYGALLSLVLHAALVTYIAVREPKVLAVEEPPIRYVEFLPQSAAPERTFVEAPGPESTEKPSAGAAYSNLDRKASMPNPTGDRPTKRPGGGNGGPEFRAPSAGVQAENEQRATNNEQRATPSNAQSPESEFVYREHTNASAGSVDWKSAIREVGKLASLSSDAGSLGGESGFAESGPISFETHWYEWGDYADGMVRKIRVNWYGNMPALIRTGMKGVVTIRFTIQRSGQITDITILGSSGVPPYDYAARKAIELSSPLAPLPKDFPNPSERVTAAFYYNLSPGKN